MPAGAITIRLKKGQSPPPGYSLLHSLRRTNIYKKNISAPGPVQAIQEAGKYYKFRCKLDGVHRSGVNWAETH